MRFEFEGVKEWRFEQIRFDMVVIFEAKAAEADGLMFFGFDGAAMSAMRPDDFRSTTAYIAARTVRFDVHPLG